MHPDGVSSNLEEPQPSVLIALWALSRSSWKRFQHHFAGKLQELAAKLAASRVNWMGSLLIEEVREVASWDPQVEASVMLSGVNGYLEGKKNLCHDLPRKIEPRFCLLIAPF